MRGIICLLKLTLFFFVFLQYSHQYMLHLFDDRLFLAPIAKNPQRILDIGTGTGIWAM